MEGEMIRAVVADDEKIIREGIAEWVDWNKLGICLVGCAKHGEEALAAVREHQADLLVTDIRMPGISGLELAEQLEREEKPPLIILISGYSDFAYAQKAVKLKCVVDYVLKPLELEQLEAVLAKTGQQILKRRHSILVPPVERTEESAGTGARMAGMTARLVRFISAGEEKETAERLGEIGLFWEEGRVSQAWRVRQCCEILVSLEGILAGYNRKLGGALRNRASGGDGEGAAAGTASAVYGAGRDGLRPPHRRDQKPQLFRADQVGPGGDRPELLPLGIYAADSGGDADGLAQLSVRQIQGGDGNRVRALPQ